MLIADRLPFKSERSKWEFPGGKVESGESPRIALAIEIEEEMQVSINVKEELGTFTTLVNDRRIQLQCFWWTLKGGEPKLNDHSEIKWCIPKQFIHFDFSEADIPVTLPY